MTHEQFWTNLQNNFDICLNIARQKNADYARHDDPFSNFKLAELIGLNVEQAILLRITDKISRLSNVLHKQNQVKDETVQDTILDTINYLNILSVYLCANSVENK